MSTPFGLQQGLITLNAHTENLMLAHGWEEVRIHVCHPPVEDKNPINPVHMESIVATGWDAKTREPVLDPEAEFRITYREGVCSECGTTYRTSVGRITSISKD